MSSSTGGGSWFARYFGFEEAGTDLRTEIIAGATTFLTMSYIIVVNPAILSEAIAIEGYGPGQVYQMIAIATILAALSGIVVMAFYANLPFGLAPGMGLNAFFAFTVVIGMGIPWQTALAAVFVEGILFILLTAIGARKYIIRLFPKPVKFSVGAGIGVFLLFLGVLELGIAIPDPATGVALGPVAQSPASLLGVAGLVFTLMLYARNIKGSIIIGIISTAVVGWLLTIFGPFAEGGALTPQLVDPFYNIMPLVGAFVDGFATIEPLSFAVVVFTFFFVDFFDTAGTLIGVAQLGGFLNEEGNLPGIDKPLMADAVGTTVGAMVGTSTVTTYIESSTGVEEGGRTGMTALVVGFFFLISLVAVPVISAIPTYASYIGLIVVGLIMLEGVTDIDWNDPRWAIPSGLTITLMPLTASISNGLGAGIIAYPLVKVALGEYDDVHPGVYVLAAVLVVYFYVQTGILA
jgi:AGZA family xanthine/uracil permease-like MFS transporter